VVRPGDTLSGIAVAHHTTARTLARLNGLRVSGVLVSGRVLRLPARGATPAQRPTPAGRYVVRPGDTLSGIAVAHHSTARTLARLNGLRVNGVLVSGRVLRLPGRAGAAGSAPVAGAGRYVVRPGDTLSGIAARAGTTLGALAAVNGLRVNGVLR